MGDFLAPPESRRWPWILAIIASLAWAAAIIATWGAATGAIAVSAKLQPLLLMLSECWFKFSIFPEAETFEFCLLRSLE
jgi:hypothetical protein